MERRTSYGVDLRQIQEYPGHANVETTMVSTHVVKELRQGVAPRASGNAGRSKPGRSLRTPRPDGRGGEGRESNPPGT